MDNRQVYAILTILLNHIGVPCFLQGQKKEGIKRIILTCVTFGVMGIIYMIKGIIKGIEILKMTDEEFAAVDKATLIVPPIKA